MECAYQRYLHHSFDATHCHLGEVPPQRVFGGWSTLEYWLEAVILLTHWGRVTHTRVSNLTIIGSDNGLSPGRRQAIIWTNAGMLLIRTLGISFSEILSEIHIFSFKKMHLKISSAQWRPFSLGLSVLTFTVVVTPTSSLPGRNDWRFTEKNFKYVFMIDILYWFALHQSFPDWPINNINILGRNTSAWVRAMAWRRKRQKSLPEPMLTWFTDVHMGR